MLMLLVLVLTTTMAMMAMAMAMTTMMMVVVVVVTHPRPQNRLLAEKCGIGRMKTFCACKRMSANEEPTRSSCPDMH